MPAFREFTRGLVTRGDAWKRPANSLSVATNVDVSQGNLKPLNGLGAAETTGLGAGTWAWIWKLGSTWLASTTVRYAVRWQNSYLAYLPIAGGQPQWTDGTTTETLGIASPTTVPTSAVGAAGNITGTSITWVYTFVTSLGQESAPSPPSNATTLSAQKGSLTTIGVSTDPSVVSRKIYRIVSGTYFYVGTIADNVTTTYTDNTAASSLTDPLLTEDSGASPALSILFPTAHLAQLWGATQNTLYYTQAGAPWAWSTSSLKTKSTIVTGATAGRDPYSDTSGAALLVLTVDSPWLLTGQTEADYRLTEAQNNFGCSAALSLVKTDKGLVWWHSTYGLILYDGQFHRLTTVAFDDDYPPTLSTTGMTAGYYNGRYHLFHSGGALICDLRGDTPVFTTSTLTAGSVYTHTDGTMYVSDGNDVKAWMGGSALTMVCRTQELAGEELREPYHIAKAAIYSATGSTVTAAWYKAGTVHGNSETLTYSTSDFAVKWAAPGLWYRGALNVTSTSTISQIDINPDE